MIKHAIILGISLSIIHNNNLKDPSINIRDAVIYEIKKYPELEIQDLYKLAYQSAMGNRHILEDTIQSWKYLEQELSSIDSSSIEPLIEPIRSDSAIVRINLRAFKAQQGNPKKLFELMIKTASEFKPSIELLKKFWNDIEQLATDGKIPFERKALAKFFKEMEEKNFPVVHHSKKVIENYKPAYRIISGKNLDIQQFK